MILAGVKTYICHGEACGAGDGKGGGKGYTDEIQAAIGFSDGTGLGSGRYFAGGGDYFDPCIGFGGGYGASRGAAFSMKKPEWSDPSTPWKARSRYETTDTEIPIPLQVISIERIIMTAIADSLVDANL